MGSETEGQARSAGTAWEAWELKACTLHTCQVEHEVSDRKGRAVGSAASVRVPLRLDEPVSWAVRDTRNGRTHGPIVSRGTAPDLAAARYLAALEIGRRGAIARAVYEGEFRLARLAGPCRSGAERGRGTAVHALPYTGDRRALCGAHPGRQSGGWSFTFGNSVSCPKCVSKLRRGVR